MRAEITDEAERDLISILHWLTSEQAGAAGEEWFQALKNAISSLSDLPQRCPLAPENERFPFEVRHLLYGSKPYVYRIIFTVKGRTVYVLHAWHDRRQAISSR